MDCPGCGGKGCLVCDDKGKIELVGCPLELVTGDIWQVIEYAELYKKGLPPVPGGALSQTQSFIEAAGFVFREENYWKKKLGIF